MQALGRLLELIKMQLMSLTLNAKLLIGSLMVILVMSLFLVSLYAGQRTMSPLNLPPGLSADARGRAISFLQTRDIAYEEQGSDILVPTDRRTIVLAQLVDNQLLDADQVDFDQLIEDDSPFRSKSENDRRYLIAKMNEVAAMLRQFRGIDQAKVVIDMPVRAGGLGRSFVPPSASVIVSSGGRGLTQDQADTIAHLVAGAHAGLHVKHVKVTDTATGQLYQARDEESRSASKNLETRLAAEAHTQESIERALAYIPGVSVTVAAQVDTREVVKQTTIYEEPKLGVTNEASRTLDSTRSRPSAEPGVRSNTGATIASAAGDRTTDERSSSQTVPAFPQTTAQIHDSKGQALIINAAIGVPRTYFLSIYHTEQGPDADEPDAATLDQLVQVESDRIRQHVEPLIDTRAAEGAIAGSVTVSMFHDLAIAGEANTAGLGGAAGGAASALEGFGVSGGLVKLVGLGGLAMASLVMMLMMVRKATAHEELPSAEELVGIPPALADTDSDLMGEAEEMEPALEGLEIDEAQIRSQEMLEQISTLVNETPDEAAHLLRKWIHQSDP